MVFSNVIVDVIISRRSFVFCLSRAKVSAGFTNVSSLAVAAFDLVYCSLPCLSSGLSLSLTLVSSRRKVVIGLCATRIRTRSIRAIVSVVPLMYADSHCRNRTRVDVVLSVGISVTY